MRTSGVNEAVPARAREEDDLILIRGQDVDKDSTIIKPEDDDVSSQESTGDYKEYWEYTLWNKSQQDKTRQDTWMETRKRHL